jgi:hypothetical protein
MRMSHLETNVLSDLAYTLLRRSEVLNDDLLQVLMDCIETLENGEITLEQAIAVIRHATNKYRSGDTG